jgi:TetR/AcrR family transcriptional repressor of lmrAB and yxaGH operons
MDAPGTRDRLVAAMRDALQRRGLHGVGLSEILGLADAPKGVLYHHFPGGKTELAAAAIDATAQSIATALDTALARHTDPVDALGAWIDAAARGLAASDYERGCPLATVALECGADDALLQRALAEAFGVMRERIALALIRAGTSADRAAGLAALLVAAYEGGLLQARVARSAEPLVQAMQTLRTLIKAMPR